VWPEPAEGGRPPQSHLNEPNGFKLWNAVIEKFLVARDVAVDETNMDISRAVQPETEFLKDSTGGESKHCPNDSQEINERDTYNSWMIVRKLMREIHTIPEW